MSGALRQAGIKRAVVMTRRPLVRPVIARQTFAGGAVLLSMIAHAGVIAAIGFAIVMAARAPPMPDQQAVVDLVIGNNAARTGARAPEQPSPGSSPSSKPPSPPVSPPSLPMEQSPRVVPDGIAPAPPTAMRAAEPSQPMPPSAPATEQQAPPTRAVQPEIRVGDGVAAAFAEIEDTGLIHPAQSDSTNIPPDYPLEAALKHQEGTVTLQIYIEASGDVSRVEIARSSGFPILDAAARDRIATWHFHPAMRDGVPVASEQEQSIRFLP